MIVCDVCGKKFSVKGIGSHKWRVHGNGKDFVPKSYGAWNKGLKKETDERVAKCGETFKQKLASGEIHTWQEGKALSEKHRNSIRQKVIQRIETKNWHSNRKLKNITYKNIHFDSSWEVKLAQWFDKHEIMWVRNRENFLYEFEGKCHVYFPDFYVPNIDCYVEVKGRIFERDLAKWNAFPKRLIVIGREELQDAKII